MDELTDIERAAKEFYRRYSNHCDNLNWQRQPMPIWEELPPDIKGHWCYMVEPIVERGEAND